MKSLVLSLFLLLALPVLSLSAQSEAGPAPDFLDQDQRKESLRELALDEIALGNYKKALNHLNAAIALSPDDRELQDLKASLEDLLLLEEEPGEPGDINPENPENPDFTIFKKPDEEVFSPDFAQELLSDAQGENPAVKRNAFSLALGVAYGQTDALYLSDTQVINDSDKLLANPYLRISVDGQAFAVQEKRNFGLGIRYQDVPYNPEDVDMLKSLFDVSIHYRGFFAETLESRLILGARLGAGFLGIREVSDSDSRDIEDDDDDDDDDDIGELKSSDISNPSIFVGGVYFSDALFRYLFKNSDFFKRLVIEMNFDFIFVTSLDDISLSQYSISGAYQFTEHFAFSVFSEAFNSSTNLQNTNSWEVGGRVKLTY